MKLKKKSVKFNFLEGIRRGLYDLIDYLPTWLSIAVISIMILFLLGIFIHYSNSSNNYYVITNLETKEVFGTTYYNIDEYGYITFTDEDGVFVRLKLNNIKIESKGE